jgi:hypothetical protein
MLPFDINCSQLSTMEMCTLALLLPSLEQTGSVAEYAANFKVHSGYNDVALCDAFNFGLKDKIKDLITKAGHPATLTTLKADTVKSDHQVMEQQHEKPASHSHTPAALPTAVTMEVDAITTRAPKKSAHGPLTAEELVFHNLFALFTHLAPAFANIIP